MTPRERTSKRVARFSTRVKSWEVITTVRPRPATSLKRPSNISQASWSRPVCGSSKSITSGSCRMARPMASRCCIPRENVLHQVMPARGESDIFKDFVDARIQSVNAVHTPVEPQVLLGSQVAVKQRQVGDHTQPGANGRGLGRQTDNRLSVPRRVSDEKAKPGFAEKLFYLRRWGQVMPQIRPAGPQNRGRARLFWSQSV